MVYQVRKDMNTIRIAKEIAKQLKVGIVQLESEIRVKCSRNSKPCVSPSDFVCLIKNAACVVTTSFHGTAFSVIFNRPFYCVELGDAGDERAKNLLASLHLSERMIPKSCHPIFSEIDYIETNKLRDKMQIESLNFLTSALNGTISLSHA